MKQNRSNKKTELTFTKWYLLIYRVFKTTESVLGTRAGASFMVRVWSYIDGHLNISIIVL